MRTKLADFTHTRLFPRIRMKLIQWLAGKTITVIINAQIQSDFQRVWGNTTKARSLLVANNHFMGSGTTEGQVRAFTEDMQTFKWGCPGDGVTFKPYQRAREA